MTDDNLPTGIRRNDAPRDRGRTVSTSIILRPLDGDGVVALIEPWENDPDETEQRETLSFLRRALDEDRLSDRKLFP